MFDGVGRGRETSGFREDIFLSLLNMASFTGLNSQKLNSYQGGPRWERRLTGALWPESTTAVQTWRKPRFSARQPHTAASSTTTTRGSSRSPSASGARKSFSPAVFGFAFCLFSLCNSLWGWRRSSEEEGELPRAAMRRKCHVCELILEGPLSGKSERAQDGRLPPPQDRQTPPARSHVLLLQTCAALLLVSVFTSASSESKERQMLLLFSQPPRALSRLLRKRLFQRELRNRPMGEPGRGPGVCKAWELLLLLRARGQGQRPALDSMKRNKARALGLAAEGVQRLRWASSGPGPAPSCLAVPLPSPWWNLESLSI